MSVCIRHTAVRWLAYIESPKTPQSFSALLLFTSFMKLVKMIVPGFMETLCRCFLTYCKPFGRDWVALCHLILHHPKERGVQIFLAHVAGISSRPLFLLYVLKVENCPFSFPGFTFSQGADTKFVGEHCKEAYKVHIADLLLKSPRCLALTPTIKTFLPVWCVPASSLNHTSLLLCLLPSQSGSFFFFTGKTPLQICRRGLSDIQRAYLTFGLYINTPAVSPVLSDGQMYCMFSKHSKR